MGSDSRTITGFFATVVRYFLHSIGADVNDDIGTTCSCLIRTDKNQSPGTMVVFSRRNKHGRFNFLQLAHQIANAAFTVASFCGGPGWRLLDWAGFANFSFKEVSLIWLVTYQNEASLFLQDCARIFTRSCWWRSNYRTAHCKVSELLVFLMHEVYSSGAAKLLEWLSMSELSLNDCMYIKGSVVARVQSFCLLLHAFVTVQ